jgi:hypothetical protein
MRALILVAAATLALAACDRGDTDQNAVVVTNNDGSVQAYQACPDGSTIPTDQTCPPVVDNRRHDVDGPAASVS